MGSIFGYKAEVVTRIAVAEFLAFCLKLRISIANMQAISNKSNMIDQSIVITYSMAAEFTK